jgi:hypothetical protein
VNLQTFVTVHDGALIDQCERTGQFAALGEYAYLGVGRRTIPHGERSVIIPRRLADNVEHLPAFYDFTGWWTLARHRLIVRPHVMFLQYDMHINSPSLEADVDALLEADAGPVAFTAGHYDAGNFMLMIDGFEDAYRGGMAAVGADMGRWAPFNEWPTTQGIAWRTDEFYDYMNWFRPLFDVWAGNVWAGHLAERTVKAWCCERGVEPRYLGGVIGHEAADCHGTGALMAGNMAVYEERARTFAT